MGIQTNLYYQGTQGNLVFYELNGGFYMRAKPSVVRQTAATRACAGTFGAAVRMAKNIRAAIAPVLPNPRDRQIMNRLNTSMYKWLLTAPLDNSANYQPVPALTGFSFNEETALSERLKLQLDVNWLEPGGPMLEIPAMNPTRDIIAPAHTVSVTLQIETASCRLSDGAITGTCSKTIIIPYKTMMLPAQNIMLPIAPSPIALVVIAASLRYVVGSKRGSAIVNRSSWMPAGIVDAVYGQS